MSRNLQLKICGMREPDNIGEVTHLAPDFMGFIFYEASLRFVGNNFSIPQNFPTNINRVGVFVNSPGSFVLEQVKKNQLDFVQLHGDEKIGDVERLHKGGISIIKAFRIDANFDFNSLKEYEPYVTYFLFDAKGEKYGGNAIHFDWQLLDCYTGGIPFFLSGGITIKDIEQLKSIKHPRFFAVDVNSGVEVSPGNKDVKKVQELTKAINKYNNEV